MLNLSVARATATQTISVLGLAGEIVRDIGGARVTFNGHIGWEHLVGDRSVASTATLAATNATFLNRSAALDSDRAVLGLGASVEIGARTSAYVQYQGRHGSRSTDHRGALGLIVRF